MFAEIHFVHLLGLPVADFGRFKAKMLHRERCTYPSLRSLDVEA